MEKPTVMFNSRGESGNIYYILNLTRVAVMNRNENSRKQNLAEYNAMCRRVYSSQSYAEALSIIRETVTLIDLDGQY
jgi:hypothetical protein